MIKPFRHLRKHASRATPEAPSAIPVGILTSLLVAAACACTPAPGGGTASSGTSVGNVESAPADQQRRPPANHAWVIFGADTVVAEVARTDEEREQGLMYRQELPDGTGMLFVFDDMEVRSFWMENTYVPLDIAFMDASYVVVSIDHMAPLTNDSHDSAGPAMFALEVPRGWFAAHGVERGDRATIEMGVQLEKPGGS
jgi:uncharacterized membrane protein (UPF0127 family)